MSGAPGRPGHADADAVRSLARAHDQDRYLAALLAPAGARDDLIALAAFAGDLQRIPASVGEPMMGEIRLQWWRDAIEGAVPDALTGNPVADAIVAAISRHALPPALLLGMIEARSFELYPDPLPDEATLDAYLDRTEGAAFGLACRILGVSDLAAPAQTIQAAGRAYGMAKLLVACTPAASRGRVLLPATRLAAAGVGVDDLLAGRSSPAYVALLRELAQAARGALSKARSGLADLPRGARTALLPIALVEPYLRALEKTGSEPLRQVAEISPLGRVSRLWWAHMSGRI